MPDNEPRHEDPRSYKGPIAWMARNSVAANLLMFVILFAGVLGIVQSKTEVFPEFSLDAVQVTVPYPGASPEDVEQGIVLAVEEAVRGIEGVKRLTSTAAEGLANVTVETAVGADPERVYDDVQSAVDRITTFPERAEEHQVTLLDPAREVISMVIAGDTSRNTLQDIAERAESALLDTPEISKVAIVGLPAVELSIEIPREGLRALGLSLPQVAQQVAAASIELPAGEVETEGGEILLRMSDEKRSIDALQDVIIHSTRGGAQVALGDIATIEDTFVDNDQETFWNGEPAVRVVAYRVGDETPSKVAEATRRVAETLRADMPEALTLTTWNDDSEILQDRIRLLVKNGLMGLGLILVLLTMFLDTRLAFWVALGMAISFLGAFAMMPMLGLSINMITLFAFIVTLGLVVDDAIVVGENTYNRLERGKPRLQAAIEGVKEMAVPVTFAILTSCAAFAPLLFVPGTVGKIFALFPAIVLLVLLFSLVESFYILPAHLGHGESQGSPWWLRWLDRPRSWIADRLEAFTNGPYTRAVEWAIEHRYVTITGAIATLAIAGGLVAGRVVTFQFFPSIQGDVVSAQAQMPFGTNLERTRDLTHRLEDAAREAIEEVGDSDDLVGMFTRLGYTPAQGADLTRSGSHLATVTLELTPAADRDFGAKDFTAAWRDAFDAPPGLETMVFNAALGPGGGAAVDVQLSHRDAAVLEETSKEVAEALRGYDELTNVDNAWAEGKPQIDYELLPNARTLGLSTTDVAQQLRGAFYGAEAFREQRERNEVRVMVRLPEHQRASLYDVESYRIRTPTGQSVPLETVAQATLSTSPTSITREDGQRVTNVRADLAAGIASNQTVNASLRDDLFSRLRQEYPNLSIQLVGQQRAMAESLSSLGPNYALAMFVVFALLAVPFRSYAQPLVVMAAIPFGLVGAVVGHLIMGYSMSIISLFGVIALSGVVVNDSLVLIDATNVYRREHGMNAREAIAAGGRRRLRPILLTSLTTFLGLTPMIFETSLQARFLIPMAISLGFGVLSATVIALLLVPSLYIIAEDLTRITRKAAGAVSDALRPEDGEDDEAARAG